MPLRFLPVTCVAPSQALDLSVTPLASLYQYSQLSLKMVHPDGLISNNATNRISKLFNTSGFEALKFPFHTTNLSCTGIKRRLKLSQLGVPVIQLRNLLVLTCK